MNEFYFVIGSGRTPKIAEGFKRVDDYYKLLGYKGKVTIVLHGCWEQFITPAQLRDVLINLSANQFPPIVQVVL